MVKIPDDYELGDAPVEKKYRMKMRRIADGIDRILNRKRTGLERRTGWILMVFPFNERDGRCNYMSNADRRDVIQLLEEQLARFREHPDSEGL